MHFFLSMNPPTKTQQEHKVGIRQNGKPYFYEDYDLKQVRHQLNKALLPFAPDKPFKNAIRLTVKWCFPSGGHPDGSYKTTKPDTDNLNKMLKDEMTKLGFWKDDALVASEVIEKFWADIPGIFINIEELKDG
ncbi:MAG: RusA family crossover junction endodeoxyribonuclease [Clostridia bacterium]|nr:RusA family crossover junction endodeoxyribonuclease [Clostridia bacterium]